MANRDIVQHGSSFVFSDGAVDFGAPRLSHTIDDVWQTLSAGREVTPRQNALTRGAAIHAVETAARVTRTTTQLGGSSSLYDSSDLQRHGRDAEAITHHFIVAPHVWEDAGRVLLGRQPLAPIF